MPRYLHTAAGLICLAALVAAAADAGEPAKAAAHSFKMTIKSHLDMEVQGATQKIEANTEVRYTWKRDGAERALVLDSVQVRVTADGNPLMNTFMSRNRVTNVQGGKTEDVTPDTATEEIKRLMQDAFGVTVCKLQVDENGRELKRAVIAGPGAAKLIDNGMIANALLFHPAYARNKNEWQADNEISMGNGGYARGRLTYKKAAGGKGGQEVDVSGALTNDRFQQPGTPVTVEGARYAVSGKQTYDPAHGEWVAGQLTMDVSFRLLADGKALATAKGKMQVSLERLPAGK